MFDLKEYYDGYLQKHQNLWNRRLHVLGQFVTLTFILSCLYSGFWFLLPLAPFVIYPFAWTGHFYFEKNKPAAFKNPILAKISDWIMLKDYLLGKIRR